MKFGKTFSQRMNPRWQDRYVPYELMKGVVNSAMATDSSSEEKAAAEARFSQLVDQCIQKLDTCMPLMLAEVNTALALVQDRWAACTANPPTAATTAAARAVEAHARKVLQDAADLEDFIQLNIQALTKVCRKLDKKAGRPGPGAALTSAHEKFEARKHFGLGDATVLKGLASVVCKQIEQRLTGVSVCTAGRAAPSVFVGMMTALVAKDDHAALCSWLDAVPAGLDLVSAGLLLACELNAPDCVRLTITRGGDPAAALREVSNYNAFHLACGAGAVECLALLIQSLMARPAADHSLLKLLLNAPDYQGRTPLAHAVEAAATPCVRLLLQYGADARANPSGTPHHLLHTAVALGQEEDARLLMEYGACDLLGDELHLACRNNTPTLLRLLLDLRAKPQAAPAAPAPAPAAPQLPPSDKVFPASIPVAPASSADAAAAAAAAAAPEAALLQADESGSTPLHAACQAGAAECLATLLGLSQNAEVLARAANAANQQGRTPLALAADAGSKACVTALLAAGARPELADNNGWTPFSHAVYNGHLDLSSLLRPTAPLQRASTVAAAAAAAKTAAGAADNAAAAAAGVNNMLAVPFVKDTTFAREDKAYSHACLYSAKNIFFVELHSLEVAGSTTASGQSQALLATGTLGEKRRIPLRHCQLVVSLQPKPDAAATAAASAAAVASIFAGSAAPSQAAATTTDNNEDTLPAILTRSTPLPLVEGEQAQCRFEAPASLEFGVVVEIVSPLDGGAVVARGLVAQRSWAKGTEGMNNNSKHAVVLLDNSLREVATLQVSCLLATAFAHPNMKAEASCSWITHKDVTIVGHRGAGASRKARDAQSGLHRTHVQENTVLSFATAGSQGAQYVEFDVQVTRDRVPVIYHNWTLMDETGLPIPVDRVPLQQFLRLRDLSHPFDIEAPHRAALRAVAAKVNAPSGEPGSPVPGATAGGSGSSGSTGEHRHRERARSLPSLTARFQPGPNFVHQPVCTLAQIFRECPPDLGFNVEIKYPWPEEKAANKLDMMEMNDYLDLILQVIFQEAKGRKLYFSCFHPDFCRLLALKQSTYPVLFLTSAGYDEVADARCQSLRGAVRFAASVGLAGIVSRAQPFLDCPEIIQEAKAHGLLVLTWGSENNEVVNVRTQERIGMDAVILDHVAHVCRTMRAQHLTD
eukprot:m.129233 g.129233  ORF g.129233 m.129233 type:complete len:1162 (-) comp16402_c3_seq2:259-3744(-)